MIEGSFLVLLSKNFKRNYPVRVNSQRSQLFINAAVDLPETHAGELDFEGFVWLLGFSAVVRRQLGVWGL